MLDKEEKMSAKDKVIIIVSCILGVSIIIGAAVLGPLLRNDKYEELYGHILEYGEENVCMVSEGYLVVHDGKMYWQSYRSVGKKEKDNGKLFTFQKEITIAQKLKEKD